jgi:hypothetical protein
MQLVIDSNMLRSPELKTFLAKSTSNKAIITDYVAMEMYKGNPLIACRHSMEILRRHQSQVVILKSTGKAVLMSGRISGLRRRLIDQRQTTEFPNYVKAIFHEPLDVSVEHQLNEMGAIAALYFSKLCKDAEDFPTIFTDISMNFAAEDMESFKRPTVYSSSTIGKVLDLTWELAAKMTGTHPNKPRPPRQNEDLNTFILRYSLCCVLLWIRWVKDGSQLRVAPQRITNDLADVNIATFATFFDGALSNDKKLRALHSECRAILNLLGAA